MSSKSSPRMTAEERRVQILGAALRVFAEAGFHGTTTKALAAAAGVSEALVFQHFPSKDHIYVAMQQECGRLKANEDTKRMMDLEPSTSTLVIITHAFIARMLRPVALVSEVENNLHRILVHSFMEDGKFARQYMLQVADDLVAKLEASARTAAESGDMVDSPLRGDLRAWFAEHFGAMLMLNQLAGKPIVDFRADAPTQVEQATWFTLLGMGLKSEAIRRHYNPKAFALLTG